VTHSRGPDFAVTVTQQWQRIQLQLQLRRRRDDAALLHRLQQAGPVWLRVDMNRFLVMCGDVERANARSDTLS